MSRKLEQLDTRKTRQQLRKIAEKLTEDFDREKSVLANAFGIKGMGKDHLLDLLAENLDPKDILHLRVKDIPESPTSTDVLDVSKQIADWVYSDILKVKEKASRDMDGLEKDFFNLRGKLSDKKDKPRFAVLVNDIHNLPFDDLDWFQSVVLEALVSSPGSMVVVTSQNELNWHSWEMRNKCEPIKLDVFSPEEILALCESQPLAQKIEELSAGHPKTVQALLTVTGNKKPLASITEDDVNALEKEFLNQLEKEIDDSLNLKGKNEWLREVFYLVSAADGFDADLVSDIVSAFNLSTPEEVTDIAWEMAYTGLAAWDFDAKTYKIVPELRERILKYMEYERKLDYSKVLETIANSYLLRAEILPDWDLQLIKYMKYLMQARNLQDRNSDTFVEIIKAIDSWLKTEEDIERFYATLMKESSDEAAFADIYRSVLKFIEKTDMQTSQLLGGDMPVSHTHREVAEIFSRQGFVSRRDIEKEFELLLRGERQRVSIVHIQGVAGIGKTYLLNQLRNIANSHGHTVISLDMHYPENRSPRRILQEIVGQSKAIEDVEAKREIDNLLESDDSDVYIGIAEKEIFEGPLFDAAVRIKQRIGWEKRPVFLIDTIDDTPSINQLELWLVQFIEMFNDTAYFVIAGRGSFESLKKSSGSKNIVSFTIGPLDVEEIHLLVQEARSRLGSHRYGDIIEFNDPLFASIVKFSGGKPLHLLWILFYFENFTSRTNWDKLIESKDIEDVLDKITSDFWTDRDARIVGKNVAALLGLQVAAYLGPLFSLELFKKAVPSHLLRGESHEKIYSDLAGLFYIRGGANYWTLHDQVREWILRVPSVVNLTNLYLFGRNLINNYYVPKISGLKSAGNLTSRQQNELDDLTSQMFYNLLFVESKPGPKAKEYHYKLWSHLDNLWHRYSLAQMSKVIGFGREVQKWKPGGEKDTLLRNILDAAQAWAFFSQAEYEKAGECANEILKGSDVPRRLRATAEVVLGLLPNQKPERAIKAYLEPARLTYEQILSQLVEDKLPNDEFTDSASEIYPEIHQVLMGIGRLYLVHSFDIEKAKSAFVEAYNYSIKPEWRDPTYSAIALNELARALRFEGEYSEALNKIMKAVSIYKRHKKDPETLANFGYFHETLALIYKEIARYDLALKALDRASKIYNRIQSPIKAREATVLLERGHIFLLSGQIEAAHVPLKEAYSFFHSAAVKHPWYHLNSLEKLGEYHMAKGNFDEARNIFTEQMMLSKELGHDIWEYWAMQHLAELDYEEKRPVNIADLDEMLNEFDQKRGRKLGPAFWSTRLLMYKLAKNNSDISAALTYLADGLAHLAGQWNAKFWQNLTILRDELLELDSEKSTMEAKRLAEFWKNRFGKSDPAPVFIDMCEAFSESI